MQQLATAMEYQRAAHGHAQLGSMEAETAANLHVDVADVHDPWWTPYKIELTDKGGYRIVGAGSDKAFEEGTWTTKGETATLTADAVLVGGTFVRSNRQWLLGFLTEAQKSEQSLSTAFPRGDTYRIVNTPANAWAWLRINELEAEAMKHDPRLVDLMRERTTQDKIKALSARFPKPRTTTHTVRRVRIPRAVHARAPATEVPSIDPA